MSDEPAAGAEEWMTPLEELKSRREQVASLTAELAGWQTEFQEVESERNRFLRERDEARRELAEAKEKHERELFDCGGINDAWAMEVDKLKAELAEATKRFTALREAIESNRSGTTIQVRLDDLEEMLK